MLFEILGALSLAVLLPQLGLEYDWIALFVWLANLPAVWFLSQAAKHQGRSAWFYGLTSIPPAIALIHFLSLWAAAKVHGTEA